MKRRVFSLALPAGLTDYRNDHLLLNALEEEIKLASRFFVIVDFIEANIDPDKEDEESQEDKNLMGSLGNYHWQRARKIIKQRRDLLAQYGRIDIDDEPSVNPDVVSTASRSHK